MDTFYCKTCGQETGYKRALGWGTFFAVCITMGFWLLAIPFYPKRCIKCGSGEPSGNARTEVNEKKCPFCAETIKTEAIVCRYCGKDLPTEIIIPTSNEFNFSKGMPSPNLEKDNNFRRKISLAYWVGFIFLSGFVVTLMIIRPPSLFNNQPIKLENPYLTPDWTKKIESLKNNKILTINIKDDTAYIKNEYWVSLNVNEKTELCRFLAYYCAIKKNTSLVWIDLFTYNNSNNPKIIACLHGDNGYKEFLY